MEDFIADTHASLLVTAAFVIGVTVYTWWRGGLPLAAMLATVALAVTLAGVMVAYL